VVITGVLYVAVIAVVTNLIIDLVYGWVDPRVRVR
jgi:ABC-type dipeptide/oligopeptide/nickel transport system permease component